MRVERHAQHPWNLPGYVAPGLYAYGRAHAALPGAAQHRTPCMRHPAPSATNPSARPARRRPGHRRMARGLSETPAWRQLRAAVAKARQDRSALRCGGRTRPSRNAGACPTPALANSTEGWGSPAARRSSVQPGGRAGGATRCGRLRGAASGRRGGDGPPPAHARPCVRWPPAGQDGPVSATPTPARPWQAATSRHGAGSSRRQCGVEPLRSRLDADYTRPG